MPRVGGKPYLFISVYLAVSNLFWMRCLKYSFSLCFSFSTPQMRGGGGCDRGCAFPSPILSNKYLKGEAESAAALVLSQALNLDKEVWKDLLHLLNSRRLAPCAVGRSETKKQTGARAGNRCTHMRAHLPMRANSTLTTGLICKD